MKQILGKITSTKMNNTVVVETERLWQHPLYKKYIKRTTKYYAENKLPVKDGTKVLIQECRPISKNKRFKVLRVIK